QLEKNFSSIFVSSLDGNFIGASDLGESIQRTYATHPSIPLPSEARYSILNVDNVAQPPRNTWTYYDKNLKPICYEESLGKQYDPRERSWFDGALKSKGIFWSNDFTYFATGDKGV